MERVLSVLSRKLCWHLSLSGSFCLPVARQKLAFKPIVKFVLDDSLLLSLRRRSWSPAHVDCSKNFYISTSTNCTWSSKKVSFVFPFSSSDKIKNQFTPFCPPSAVRSCQHHRKIRMTSYYVPPYVGQELHSKSIL